MLCLGRGLAVLPPEVRRLAGSGLLLLPWVLAGYGYAHWRVGQALAERVPLCADAEIRSFQLQILDSPALEPLAADTGNARTVARFRATVRMPQNADCPFADAYQVRMSWYEPPAIAQGDLWQVEGRLRPPWGNLNPGGFDYERWLLGQGLAGTGYVRRGIRLVHRETASDWRTGFRSRLSAWLAERHPAQESIILALMTGDDSRLSRAQWQLLRDSGTVHLLVVSGLHVGMVSGFLYGLFRLLARASTTLLCRFGARRLAGGLTLLGSGIYVWLSGAGMPAVRAWVMSAVLLLALTSGRSVRGLRVVAMVLVLMLLADPLMVHQQGFWLSFVAVAALVGYFEPGRRVPQAGSPGARSAATVLVFAQVQVLLLLVLAPFLSGFQGGVPVHSPLMNGVVVPLIALLVLPLILLAGMAALPLPWLAGQLVGLVDVLLTLAMHSIEVGARVPSVMMALAGPGEWMLVAATLLCLAARPAAAPVLVLLALWWAVLLPDGVQPPGGTFRITALDVGQGTAIVVDTRRHRLIYDTGAAYASGFDMGDAVVVPSFRRSGVQSLAGLVLSHDDLDHTGGARSVIRQLAPERIWASFPAAGREYLSGTNFARCTALTSWQWDGVRFQFLHPPAGWQGSDNDGSCVLLISAGGRSALLAGDISGRVERRLPAHNVDLLFAPHHGSRTSSSEALVRRMQPDIVFISTDRRSRYGHPHADVIARYAAAQVFVTGRQGALVWESGNPAAVLEWRARLGAYWHRPYAGQQAP